MPLRPIFTDTFRKLAPHTVVNDLSDLRRFYFALLDAGINFHPEESAANIGHCPTGKMGSWTRTFSDGEAALLDAAMLRGLDVTAEALNTLEIAASDEEFDRAGDTLGDRCWHACEVFEAWERNLPRERMIAEPHLAASEL